jgi:rare lipoprotein A (peptidoglycan hydrolase)
VVTHRTTTDPVTAARPHPHAVEPVAGQAPAKSSDPQVTVTQTSGGAPSPNQPATITRAPAKGAPTDAQVRAAIARFQIAVARYHLNRLNFANVLLNPDQLPPGQYNVSIASFYTDYGNGVACGGILRPSTLGVANKTLPCGTKVLFRYGNRAIEVRVIDRGPYIPGREWDLTGATAEALRFPGLGPIEWRLVG